MGALFFVPLQKVGIAFSVKSFAGEFLAGVPLPMSAPWTGFCAPKQPFKAVAETILRENAHLELDTWLSGRDSRDAKIHQRKIWLEKFLSLFLDACLARFSPRSLLALWLQLFKLRITKFHYRYFTSKRKVVSW